MVIKVAHRGAMGYEPENTLLSFQKAKSKTKNYQN